MLRVLPFLLIVGLYVYVLIDLATARGDDVRALPRPVWLLVILVIPVLGAIGWLVFGRPLPARGNGGGGLGTVLRRPAPGGSPGARPRPVAPDDDPDFLRKLDEERRRAGGTDSPE